MICRLASAKIFLFFLYKTGFKEFLERGVDTDDFLTAIFEERPSP
jgi:hypothetical protein